VPSFRNVWPAKRWKIIVVILICFLIEQWKWGEDVQAYFLRQDVNRHIHVGDNLAKIEIYIKGAKLSYSRTNQRVLSTQEAHVYAGFHDIRVFDAYGKPTDIFQSGRPTVEFVLANDRLVHYSVFVSGSGW
jgi:hypothetical protein